ncbi:YHS domain-containing protein, partial [Candidatus Parcubacteria bacterium]
MATNTVRDPVCGMEIDPAGAAQTREVRGQTFYFCSDPCADMFDVDPHLYMAHHTQSSQP